MVRGLVGGRRKLKLVLIGSAVGCRFERWFYSGYVYCFINVFNFLRLVVY